MGMDKRTRPMTPDERNADASGARMEAGGELQVRPDITALTQGWRMITIHPALPTFAYDANGSQHPFWSREQTDMVRALAAECDRANQRITVLEAVADEAKVLVAAIYRIAVLENDMYTSAKQRDMADEEHDEAVNNLDNALAALTPAPGQEGR